jgi:hypothetical protein
MRKGLGRAARVLMAAGALALSRPAAAQGPKPEVLPAAEEKAATSEQDRREELRVTFAWLTDPATFPLGLTARVRGGSLEAGGAVPDAKVKEVALKLARQHTALPVVDALEVRPAEAAKHVLLPAAAVQRQAAAVLSVAVGPRGRGMTVQARPDGQVTVRGSVGSLEEKLFVSQRLRQVTGCTSVDNRLTVSPTPEPPAPAATVRAPAGSLQEKLLVSQQLRQGGGRSLPAQPAEGEKAPPTVRVTSVTPAPAPAPASPGALSRLAPSLSAPEADLHLPGRGPKPAPAEKMTVAGPAKAPPPAVVLEESEPPAPPVAPKPVPVAAPMARGSLVTTAPQAAPGPVPAYATGPQEVAPAPNANPAALVPARLRQRVRAAAGDKAIAVQVLTLPDQSVRVRVRVASYDVQAQLSSRILQLPEMRAPNVSLEFQVAP